MGQRLNIEIISDGNTIANAYYHWSAYTHSAFELTKVVCETVCDLMDTLPPLELAIAALEATGAGINEKEAERIAKDERFSKLLFKPCMDRNTGLLAVTPRGIAETEDWMEGRVSIDFDTEKVYFDVLNYYSEEEFEDEFSEDIRGGEWLRELDKVKWDPDKGIPIEDLSELEDVLSHPNGVRLKNGDVVLWIE